MLQITIPAVNDLWDEGKQEFRSFKEQTLQLEHSLISLSKWEAKWHKSFLDTKDKSFEETLDYIKCMTLTQNVNPDVYYGLTKENVEEINRYIDDPMTATFFSGDRTKKRSRKIITSELIYYWMVALNIPFECQKWHINRLLTLIRVCEEETNTPNKKRSRKEVASQYAALNAARRKKLNTKG